MGVNFTRSGGIYIEISGDYSQLKKTWKPSNLFPKTQEGKFQKLLATPLIRVKFLEQ